MSLLRTSPDLRRLVAEGYDLEVRAGHLLVKDVPYVTTNRDVRLGTLVSELTTAGDMTTTPGHHVAMFAGEFPCDIAGNPLEQIRAGGGMRIDSEFEVHHTFSSKPVGGGRYENYYDKMTAYIAILSSPAHKLQPGVSAKTHPVFEPEAGASVFNYEETASGRAGITAATEKLALDRVAVVGVGGTGSYVLDLLAKTPVREIHLFDADEFLTHNAFRGPGAPAVAELREKPQKVPYFAGIYSRMHRAIFQHPYAIDESNADELRAMNFVFLCVDAGKAKRAIVEALEEFEVPFIDVGLGVDLIDDQLRGQLRVTTSTPNRRDHYRRRVSLASTDLDDEYATNIQVADLNMLNAALAVMRWKKWCGFYLDLGTEHNSIYVTDANALINDDVA